MVWEFPAVSHTRYDFWKAKQYTQSGMWRFTLVFGALGLHHYMLRSPQTGMIFFLTNVLLCGYPWFYDLIQLSSYGESMDELNEFGLGHPWGPLGMAQGMWRRGDEAEVTEDDTIPVITGAVAAISAAIGAVQKGGGDPEGETKEGDSKEGDAKACPKDEYTAPNPLFFILYNLCVPLSPLAHLIGGNRERAFTRFLYLFAGIIFALVFTVIFGILWFFLPSSVSDIIYGLYPTALAIVSLAYVFAVIYDYLIMFFVPSSLFFNSKECNLNGFVGFKEDPPCPSTQDPMSVVRTVLKPATDIVYPIALYIYGTFKSIGNGIYAMTPMGRAEMMAKMAAGAAAKAGIPGAGAIGALAGPGGLKGAMPTVPAIPGMPGVPTVPTIPAVPGMPGLPVPKMSAVPAVPAVPGMPGLPGVPLPKQKGGAYKELEPLDYLGGGVIGAVLLGGFILGAFRNVSQREYWLNDTPPKPRGV